MDDRIRDTVSVNRIEQEVTSNLLRMTEELSGHHERTAYGHFNQLALQTYFLILRRIVVTDEEDEGGYRVRLSGVGYYYQPDATKQILQDKRSIFALTNKHDYATLLKICELFEEHSIIRKLVEISKAPYLFKVVNLVEFYYLIRTILDRDVYDIDVFTKAVARNFVLSTLTALSVLYKLFEERMVSMVDSERVDYVKIRDQIGEDIRQSQALHEEETKRFYLNRKTGILRNPADESRNISFKVETFNNILWTIRQQLLGRLPGEGKAADEIIYEGGYVPGLKFGREFNNILAKKDLHKPQEIIQAWFDFDSDVGFGKFESQRFNRHDFLQALSSDSKEVGIILLHHNFLIEYERYQDINEFIRGYIEGVLNGIFLDNDLFGYNVLERHGVRFKAVERRDLTEADIDDSLLEAGEDHMKSSIFLVYVENLNSEALSCIIARDEIQARSQE